MYCPILRPDHAKIFSVETKWVNEKYSFNSIFQIRIHLHSSKSSFTLRATNPAGLLRHTQIHNPPRSNQVGEFVHASYYPCRSYFKALQTMSQWCWWLEISCGIFFLPCRDGDGSTHCSSPAWHLVSCYVESAHVINRLEETEGPHGTQNDWEWVATAGVISPASNLLSLLCWGVPGKAEDKSKRSHVLCMCRTSGPSEGMSSCAAPQWHLEGAVCRTQWGRLGTPGQE